MQNIEIDAKQWKERRHIYDAILPAIGAPQWHGMNANALIESMVYGEINTLEPPYRILIRSATNLPPDVVEELAWVKEGLEEARADLKSRYGSDALVSIEIVD